MDPKFTQKLETLEEYSLALADLFEKLPDHFFEHKELSPSENIVNKIIRKSKSIKMPLSNESKLYRFMVN
jgi:hypothetical protein